MRAYKSYFVWLMHYNVEILIDVREIKMAYLQGYVAPWEYAI